MSVDANNRRNHCVDKTYFGHIVVSQLPNKAVHCFQHVHSNQIIICAWSIVGTACIFCITPQMLLKVLVV